MNVREAMQTLESIVDTQKTTRTSRIRLMVKQIIGYNKQLRLNNKSMSRENKKLKKKIDRLERVE